MLFRIEKIRVIIAQSGDGRETEPVPMIIASDFSMAARV